MDGSGITNTPLKKMQQHEETMKTYCASAVSLLNMLLRDKHGYTIPLPNDIEAAVESLKDSLEGPDLDTATMDHVHTVLVNLWSREWRPTSENTLPDPTIRCLALRSIKQDGGFQTAHRVTPDIAHFEYLMRLTGMEQVHHLARTKYNGDQLKAVKDVEIWVQEKRISTFNSLRSLMHVASSIVFNSPVLPKTLWVDRDTHEELMWQGYNVKLDHLRQGCARLETQMVKRWEEDILMGLDLRVEYDRIVEDLTNDTVGYSFLTDHRNGMFLDRDRMIRAVMADPILRARFFDQQPDGSYTPNRDNWFLWMLKYAEFNKDENTSVETKAGAPTRLSELNAMACKNTEWRTRNWSHMDKHSVVNLTYTKTGSITGQDKLIPHALDALTADLMIQDHALARPFAELACQILYPGDKTRMGLYRNRLFVGYFKELTTTDISNHMHEIFRPLVGFKLGVQAFRQIHAAFSRKHCGQMEALLEASEVNTAQVLQYGHTRSIHDNIYGVSADATAGPSEDILPLFLDASTDWQRVMRVVQG